MKKYWFYIICACWVLAVAGCGKDGGASLPEPTPEPELPVVVPESDDPGVLYNGIILPEQWPPKRSYLSDIRSGMHPFYLSAKPEVVNISVGRQLFVDNFLIESTTL